MHMHTHMTVDLQLWRCPGGRARSSCTDRSAATTHLQTSRSTSMHMELGRGRPLAVCAAALRAWLVIGCSLRYFCCPISTENQSFMYVVAMSDLLFTSVCYRGLHYEISSVSHVP